MKKFALMIAIGLGAVSTASAQYTPKKGDFAVEIGFTPFKSNGNSFELNEGMIKGRYFITGKDVVRAGLNIGMDSKNTTNTNFLNPEFESGTPRTVSSTTTESLKKRTDFSFALGYERHLKTFDRFDIYVGAELGYGLTKMSGEEKTNSKSEQFNARNVKQQESVSSSTIEYKDCDGDPTIGGTDFSNHHFEIGAFTGVDFYIYKNLYLGAELGLRYTASTIPTKSSWTSYSEITTIDYTTAAPTTTVTTSSYSSATGVTTTTTTGSNPVSSYGYVNETESATKNLKFYVVPVIRLGWRF